MHTCMHTKLRTDAYSPAHTHRIVCVIALSNYPISARVCVCSMHVCMHGHIHTHVHTFTGQSYRWMDTEWFFVNGVFCFFYLGTKQSIPVYTEEREKEGERKRREEEEDRGEMRKNIQRSPCLAESFDSGFGFGLLRQDNQAVILPWR